jgi:hypothetical protein
MPAMGQIKWKLVDKGRPRRVQGAAITAQQ